MRLVEAFPILRPGGPFQPLGARRRHAPGKKKICARSEVAAAKQHRRVHRLRIGVGQAELVKKSLCINALEHVSQPPNWEGAWHR